MVAPENSLRMSQKPKTFAEQFYLEEATFSEKLRRDLRLIRWMWQFVMNWAQAAKFRQEFQRSREESGEPFYVDRFTPPTNKQ